MTTQGELVDAGFPVGIPAFLADARPQLVSQGAEALVFTVDNNAIPVLDPSSHEATHRPEHKETKVVAKYRPPKAYRHVDLDGPLRRRRTNAEARVLQRLRDSRIPCPALLAYDGGQGVIIMEHLDGLSLKQYAWDSVLDEVLDMFRALGELVSRMHALGIAHGDLTTSNAIVVKDDEGAKVHLIDFGLSSLAATVESKAVDMYVLERSITSTHPKEAQPFIDAVFSTYTQGADSRVLSRLDQVRQRGRKRTLIG